MGYAYCSDYDIRRTPPKGYDPYDPF
jgi:hypothetical protein